MPMPAKFPQNNCASLPLRKPTPMQQPATVAPSDKTSFIFMLYKYFSVCKFIPVTAKSEISETFSKALSTSLVRRAETWQVKMLSNLVRAGFFRCFTVLQQTFGNKNKHTVQSFAYRVPLWLCVCRSKNALCRFQLFQFVYISAYKVLKNDWLIILPWQAVWIHLLITACFVCLVKTRHAVVVLQPASFVQSCFELCLRLLLWLNFYV